MGIIRRYRTAWSRHHRSAGFGIHSPHAYHFVRNVLREQAAYYAYSHLAAVRKQLDDTRHELSLQETKLLFRVVNHFGPASVLLVGAHTVMAQASISAVSHTTQITLVAPPSSAPLPQHVTPFDQPTAAFDHYRASLPDGQHPFVVVDDLPDHAEQQHALRTYLLKAVVGNAVLVFHHLRRNAALASLCQQCAQARKHGQLFTNEKTAIIVANPKLQREDFMLWL